MNELAEIFKRIAELFKKDYKQGDYTLAGPGEE